jgi:hypothetical protein
MTLDERSKYRRLLADNHSPSTPLADAKSPILADENSIPS